MDLPSCIPRHLAPEEQKDLFGHLEKLEELFKEIRVSCLENLMLIYI